MFQSINFSEVTEKDIIEVRSKVASNLRHINEKLTSEETCFLIDMYNVIVCYCEYEDEKFREPLHAISLGLDKFADDSINFDDDCWHDIVLPL